jgi:hypothetical protein
VQNPADLNIQVKQRRNGAILGTLSDSDDQPWFQRKYNLAKRQITDLKQFVFSAAGGLIYTIAS